MRGWLLVAALLPLAAAVAGCAGGSPAADPDLDPPAFPGLRFIALGDMGTGEDDQRRVASAIEQVCAERGCDLALGLGDLIYPAGASSPDDPQFDTKFEEPYANLSFPFYMALGNHDVSQDPTGTVVTAGIPLWYQAGQNEVDYAKRTDRASEKWTMPDRHYAFTAGDAGFLALDTNVMLWYGFAVPPDLADQIQAQEDWLPGAVAAMTQTWRFAFGHHPYISNGEHGNAGAYDGIPAPGYNGDHLKDVFERELCGKIDVYLAGHDHHLQWLEPVPACGATRFLISGGGGAALYELSDANAAVAQEKSFGFVWLNADGPRLHLVAFDQDGQALFEDTLTK